MFGERLRFLIVMVWALSSVRLARSFGASFSVTRRFLSGRGSSLVPPPSIALFSTMVVPDGGDDTTTTTTTTTTTPRVVEYPKVMSEEERYMFDLQGFVIVRGVLSPEEVAEANAAIDRHSDQAIERADAGLRNAVKDTPMYGSGPGRMDLGGCLEWGLEDSRIFRSILAHPRLVPLYHGILGEGYRMDHLPLVLMQGHGAEGFSLHGGTIDCVSGAYNPHLAYHCYQGMLRSSLLGVNIMLTDHNAGDGGFCIVPGSHKSNFKTPPGLVDGVSPVWRDCVKQTETKAGDVILFSEGTVHGALPWTPVDRPRRACLFRFAPSTHAYGRSYHAQWPAAIYQGLNDAERAVLEPPYADRLDRPIVQAEDTTQVEIRSRSPRKKLHDQQVFGTEYF